jgi:hypothetical protein
MGWQGWVTGENLRASKGISINLCLNFNLPYTELIEVPMDKKSTGNKND